MERSDSFKAFLNQLYAQFQFHYLDRDPLELVRAYSDPKDQEVAGFIAAALSFGRVDLFRKAIVRVLNVLGPSPARALFDFIPHENFSPVPGFVYRFYREQDIGLLFLWIHRMLRESGSLQSFFLKGYSDQDADIGPALSGFVRSILAFDPKPFYEEPPPKGSGIRHFLSDPADGSSCKRLNLYLRWMVRRDVLDLGLWQSVSPAKLIMPLDTHIARISKRLGLTTRSAADWKMAQQITDVFRQLNPEDPVKYDFSLCTVGKLYACPGKNQAAERCGECPIAPFCVEVSGLNA